ncbi:DUF4871 domain-containing protein [Metasolibacillus meyeri]|uniref:DUF4871 domain-containing protein n=1 Tax=Metasolibacillus meyeri TaxID=1071052 RepID=A0AAW9NLX9_9BACL|nr:DUF4871 domain-containing protein [Metasolibacillus meyeri]MEC1176960.1 DUF4871 domain-containing protein [Metasolibacillus meyeri]
MKFWLPLFGVLLLLAACADDKKEAWQESEFFESGSFRMLGIKDKVGFIYDREILPFTANQPNKYMWHFWGDEDVLKGDIKVTAAFEEEPEQKIEILYDKIGFLSAHNGADYHIPSIMELPQVGMWKLEVYLDDKIFDTIYVEVM